MFPTRLPLEKTYVYANTRHHLTQYTHRELRRNHAQLILVTRLVEVLVLVTGGEGVPLGIVEEGSFSVSPGHGLAATPYSQVGVGYELGSALFLLHLVVLGFVVMGNDERHCFGTAMGLRYAMGVIVGVLLLVLLLRGNA